jgi:hypothetical protein
MVSKTRFLLLWVKPLMRAISAGAIRTIQLSLVQSC